MHTPNFPPLPPGPYAILYADPPWDYRGQLQHAGRGSGDSGGAIRHYPTVTLAELRQLPVGALAAADCLLFLWATSPARLAMTSAAVRPGASLCCIFA